MYEQITLFVIYFSIFFSGLSAGPSMTLPARNLADLNLIVKSSLNKQVMIDIEDYFSIYGQMKMVFLPWIMKHMKIP